ncbi:MAG: hypothetical protein A2046_02260 [Bacteroidetes bacterium GWA2_30_7]|nr:MAG: hypothetical protein A2046_02260 [Bacteroidetes bacterium GWA2_30_7]
MISNEDKKFFRDINIEESSTFFDLHIAIQDEVGFDKAQLASFFITDEKWQKKHEISLLEMKGGKGDIPLIMDETLIAEHIKELKQKLIYVFDFFSARAFFLEFVEVKDKIRHKKYPHCSNGFGEPPAQIKFERGSKKNNFLFEEEEPANDDEFDEDELDLNGEMSEEDEEKAGGEDGENDEFSSEEESSDNEEY